MPSDQTTFPFDLAEAGEVLAAELERQELSGDHDEPWSDAAAAAAVIEAFLRITGRPDEAEAVARALDGMVRHGE